MEPYQKFLDSSLLGLNQALSYGENVLIVAHGIVYQAILDKIQLRQRYYRDNCVSIYHKLPAANSFYWSVEPLCEDNNDLFE